MQNKKELGELIEATRQHINLREDVIEKDYYVTQIIHALSKVENEYFRLAFCGGTCLAKAHKIVQRMSEDVDFKIQLKNDRIFSKTHLNKELQEFRSSIKETLALPELLVTNDMTRNEGRYQQITLKYPNLFAKSTALRADIKTEFTYAETLLPAKELNVKTIIDDALNINIFVTSLTKCISVEETFIEKWVAMTRRVIAIERGYEEDDKTLIRHVYDLNAISHVNNMNPDFAVLAKSVVIGDGKQFKNQHPEYASDPYSEIKQSLNLLKSSSIWEARYEEFVEVMVYGKAVTMPYREAVNSLEHISSNFINSLNIAT